MVFNLVSCTVIMSMSWSAITVFKSSTFLFNPLMLICSMFIFWMGFLFDGGCVSGCGDGVMFIGNGDAGFVLVLCLSHFQLLEYCPIVILAHLLWVQCSVV